MNSWTEHLFFRVAGEKKTILMLASILTHQAQEIISYARRNLEGDCNRKRVVNTSAEMLVHLTGNMCEDSILLHPQGNIVCTGRWKACRMLLKHSANDYF